MTRRCAAAFGLLLILVAALSPAVADPIAAALGKGEAAPVWAEPISQFRVGSAARRFGDFVFVGGLDLRSSNRLFGAMSSIRLSPDRSAFLGVMDTGHWFSGRLRRDESGRLSGIEDVHIAAMRDASGAIVDSKWLIDAEGLTVADDGVLVSFERKARIDLYEPDAVPFSGPARSLDHPIPPYEFRANRGLETVAVAPSAGALAGATVIVSEMSINQAGDIFAAVLDGPRAGVFFVERTPPYAVTDGDFLPNGDLLLLERRFTMADGVGMRILKIAAADVRPGATVSGKVLLEAGFEHQIDNMEGLDVSVDAAGQVTVLLVSDDNRSILQRNLFLEFRLVE